MPVPFLQWSTLWMFENSHVAGPSSVWSATGVLWVGQLLIFKCDAAGTHVIEWIESSQGQMERSCLKRLESTLDA